MANEGLRHIEGIGYILIYLYVNVSHGRSSIKVHVFVIYSFIDHQLYITPLFLFTTFALNYIMWDDKYCHNKLYMPKLERNQQLNFIRLCKCRSVLIFICRLHSTHHDIVKVIGTSLRNLEELILGYIDFNYYGVIRFLVSGCRKLKILHVERGVTIKCAEYLLLGLPNLIEFKHPLMVVALEWIIRSGKADRVSAIRKLYIGAGDDDESQVSMYLESAHMVMRHLTNITMLEMNIRSAHCIKPLKSFSVKITNISQLTKLIIKDFSVTISDYVLPIVQAMGHYLTLLDLLCLDYSWLDVIDHCRELRVLRITAIYKDVSRFDIVQPEMGDQNYGSDPQENITPFHHLQELHLSNLINAHLKPALLKSLVASPLLQDLKLRRIHSFTDHVVKAAFNHINQDGEQLAFTSLRTLELDCCNFITNNLMKLVTHERVPLEELLVTLWVTDVETEIFERFKEKMNDANDDDDDYENERYLNRDIDSPFDYICFGD